MNIPDDSSRGVSLLTKEVVVSKGQPVFKEDIPEYNPQPNHRWTSASIRRWAFTSFMYISSVILAFFLLIYGLAKLKASARPLDIWLRNNRHPHHDQHLQLARQPYSNFLAVNIVSLLSHQWISDNHGPLSEMELLLNHPQGSPRLYPRKGLSEKSSFPLPVTSLKSPASRCLGNPALADIAEYLPCAGSGA
ncbi:hypothetical protein BDV06DRAFT_228338 [Aspergillus oleicola]